MAVPTPKVEVGFDLTDNPWAPFFQLDDATKGRLDNEDYRLAGPLFYDVSDRVIGLSIERGKAAILSEMPPGECQVDFTNHDRAFDPLFESSPFYPEIVPRREIRISADDELIFSGWIEDWDLDYQPDGDSVATAKAYDALSILGNQTLNAFTPSVETSGQRINTILDRSEVNWPSALRDIDAGTVDVADTPSSAGNNVITYLENIAGSDPGFIFIDKAGRFAFRDKLRAPTSANLVALGEGGIPHSSMQVEYGSELLFNRVTATRQGGGTAIANDVVSQNDYGVRDLTINDLQLTSDTDLADFVVNQISLYSEPEYRFTRVTVNVERLDVADQEAILALDLGDICSVTFTPNGIGPAIERYVEVREITHRVDLFIHRVELGFNELRYAPLVLDDAVFGKLDVGRLSW
mgnify:FL=1